MSCQTTANFLEGWLPSRELIHIPPCDLVKSKKSASSNSAYSDWIGDMWSFPGVKNGIHAQESLESLCLGIQHQVSFQQPPKQLQHVLGARHEKTPGNWIDMKKTLAFWIWLSKCIAWFCCFVMPVLETLRNWANTQVSGQIRCVNTITSAKNPYKSRGGNIIFWSSHIFWHLAKLWWQQEEGLLRHLEEGEGFAEARVCLKVSVVQPYSQRSVPGQYVDGTEIPNNQPGM